MDIKDLLTLAAHETQSRPLRYSSIPILDYKPSREDGKALALPGTIVLYLAEKGSRRLAAIRDAISSRNSADRRLAEEILAQHEGRSRLPTMRAWDIMRRSPVIASIRYGGRTLANNMIVPPWSDIVWITCPYNGGRLSTDELTLVEHVLEGSEIEYEALAVSREPRLTAAEKAALSAVPEDQLELNLAPNGSCCDDITMGILIMIATAIAQCGKPLFDDFHIQESELRNMSPTAAAIRLMEIRRDALGHEH